jgi:Alr-MurF fusion protein
MQQLSFISLACKAEWFGDTNDVLVRDIITDSRQIGTELQTLFAAIVTSRNDGHQYIKEAYDKGVRIFLISQLINLTPFPEAAFLLVDDTVAALQLLAIKIRAQFDIPVLGITGSNGKTIVKEWLNYLLGNTFKIVCSPKSYNSQIGVPLSVWQMESGYTLGIFEAGISQANEMDLLEKIIRPTIGIFTNIGEAHAQGFINIRQKINEKLQLFKHSEVLIYCRDYPELNDCISTFAQSLNENTGKVLQLFSWSYKQEALLQIKSVSKSSGTTVIEARYKDSVVSIAIPFTDAASIENAINCWCVLLYFNIPLQQIQEGMMALKPIAM